MDLMTFTSDTLVAFSPEILLAVGAMVLLMIGAFRDDGALGVVTGGAIALIVTTLALVHVVPSDGLRLFGNSIILDGFAKFLKTLTLIGSAAAVIMSIDWMRSARMDRFEYPVLIVLATLGMMIMISAGDLIALYMGIELQSLALYVVASIQRDSTRSTEAGLKYFALGALSSGMLLYGCSLIYGFSGTIELAKIATLAGHGEASVGLVFGLVFLIAGLAFKVSAVPFHMWTPDVYEGAPTPVTAFFASAPKIAGMAVFVRAMISGFPTMTPEWQQVIVFVSIASMVLGAFAAIGLIPDGGAGWQLQNALGPRRALEAIVEGRRIKGPECLALGLANKVVARGEASNAALQWAQELALGAPLAQAAAKLALREMRGKPLDEAISIEARLQQALTESEDFRNGVASFFAKRKPEFRGR